MVVIMLQTTLGHHKRITDLDHTFRNQLLKLLGAGEGLELCRIDVVRDHPVMLELATVHQFTDIVCKR